MKKKRPTKQHPKLTKPRSRGMVGSHQPKVQPAPQSVPSPYNPRGLRLAAIKAHIRNAYARKLATQPMDMLWPPDYRGVGAEVKLVGLLEENRMCLVYLSPVEADQFVFPLHNPIADGKFGSWAKCNGVDLADTPEKALARDRRMAETIRDNPTALLLTPGAQDAIARWTYGNWYGWSKQVKQTAGDLLDVAKGAKGGRPALFKGNLSELRAAYADLVEYGKGLRQCVKASRHGDDVLAHFPDAGDLKSSGIDAVGAVTKRSIRFPTARGVAEAVFGQVIGWASRQLHKNLFGK